MVACLKKFLRCEKGQSLVETAVVLPIVLLLFCGIVDFGWILGNQLIVENGSREGARLGAVVSTESDYQDQIEDRVLAVTPGYARSGIRVSSQVAQGDVTVTVTYTFPLLTPLAQTILGKQDFKASSACVMRAE